MFENHPGNKNIKNKKKHSIFTLKVTYLNAVIKSSNNLNVAKSCQVLAVSIISITALLVVNFMMTLNILMLFPSTKIIKSATKQVTKQ